jgi:hypothetical protein
MYVKNGFPFFSIYLDKVYEEIMADEGISNEEKHKLILPINLTGFPDDVHEKRYNTLHFFKYAIDKGKSPISYPKN